VVLHQLRLVVIAVRGTETPEDLITDGLCKECILSSEDLDGLMKYISLSLLIYLHFYVFMAVSVCVMIHCLGDP
jgi:hypothetical protein